MGPTGDEFKRGPAPVSWDVFYRSVDHVIDTLNERIGQNLKAKHMVIATPASARSALKFAHVLSNSAGEPFFSDPTHTKRGKAYHIRAAIRGAKQYLFPTQRLPLWPSLVFARGDRAAEFELYLDDEQARSQAVMSKRDRKIDAQSFILQLLDGIFTQAFADAISEGPVPEIDLREPMALSNWFEQGAGVSRQLGDDGFSIGTDTSAWDQHMTPQMWYACYLIYKAAFAETQSILVFETDTAVQVPEHVLTSLDDLPSGATRSVTLTGNRAGVEVEVEADVTRVQFDTEPVLRRVFAGVSGTPVRLGNIVADGLQHVLDTPRDGKILLGYSQRSGNFCTFLTNCLANWWLLQSIAEASTDETELARFESEFGYRPPPMALKWLVVRGDDAAQVWSVPDRSSDWTISQLYADWAILFGNKANAKKQDTSDIRGRWRLAFAQLFTNENFVRGVSSVWRVLERNVWNEADEVVRFDPDTGEDFADVLQVMNTYGRTNNLYGVWNRDEHPRAFEAASLLQDLDENRLLPPLDEEERLKAARAYALKLLRRGQIAATQIDDAIRHFWTTDLSQDMLRRYNTTPRLEDRSWSPLNRYGEDARPHWRKRGTSPY